MTPASHSDNRSVDWGGRFALVAEVVPPRATVTPRGELDLASAPMLERGIAALPWSYFAELVFDLAELTFTDCAGLHVLTGALRRATTAGLPFSVVRVRAQPRKLFALAGVTDSLNLTP